MARTPGPAPLCPGGGKAQLSSASPPGAGLLLPPPTPPPLLLLLFPLLLFSRLCGALAGPIIVEPHVTAVWGKNVSLKCLIEVNETITQISWEKIHGKSSQTVAVHHPQYGFSVQGEYQGRVLFKNYSLNDATITLHNIGFSDSGKYICKAVTFPLGNAQSSTTVTVLVEPTVSLIKGPDSLIDGGNETVAAICIAATGKPVAHIDWEGDLGEMESTTTSFPNETATIVSQYKLFPTRFARGRRITCVVKHPALEKDIRYSFILDIQYAPEVSVTGYDGNWFVGRKGVNLKCNADANPPPFKSVWSRLDGQWPDGLLASDNTLHFVHPLTFNYSGVYVCKVTNSLGQRSDQKVIYISDVPFKQTSSIAVAGAVIGAVLALFIIAIFVTVLLTPRKKRPSYLDKVIDLPPTHKPPPMYEERSPPLPQKDLLYQTEHLPLQTQFREREVGGLQHSNGLSRRRVDYEDENPVGEAGIQQMCPLYNQICQKDRSPGKHRQSNDPERVYINPREHYV
ncbi:nectin-3 isoform X2 [Prionailurus viverrinus]|uniref:Ig-like domain-containing protein n=1 Tax=Felis catus TaxID=9685 RepID=A0ABI7XAH0_FELCA|nr:nectin-3 isoform X2 [Felis catus]XP_043450030.1 nectin-3 isoform X2 [Prionailurus bengalensis]XP_047732101.1 nectin-3 isoform X2 [Prionailurus viverrinus]